MKSINSVVLAGFVYNKSVIPDQNGSGFFVARFTLGVARKAKSKKTGDYETITDFIRCATFGTNATNFEKYVQNGYLVSIQGSIVMSKYQSKTGEMREESQIVANIFNVLDSEPNKHKRIEPRENEGYASPNQTIKQYPSDYDDSIPF